ncbi:MAG: hypothetical protein AAF702_16750 [Chloroflexota bacterium]
MGHNSRQTNRLFFLIVLVSAMFGWWYASTTWQLQPETILGSGLRPSEGDWIDFIAAIAEQMMQLFIGLASPE